MPRALAGNALAASRLYRDTLHCVRVASTAAQFDFMLELYRGGTSSAVVLENQEIELASMQAEMEHYSETCAGIDPKVISEALYPIVRQSALLGNEQAAACYVYAGMFEFGPYTDRQKASFRSDYEENALAIAESAIERGSWEMVGLMRAAYASDRGGNDEHGWLNAMVNADPLKFYAYWLLAQNGMANREPPDEKRLVALADMLERIRSNSAFSPAEQADAAAWADRMYRMYFSSKPFPISSSRSLCDPGGSQIRQ